MSSTDEHMEDFIRQGFKKMKKDELIEEYIRQEEELRRAYEDRNRLRDSLREALRTKPEKFPVNVSLCLDAWPPKDWFRFQIKPWSEGRYFQAAIGPIRLDIFE